MDYILNNTPEEHLIRQRLLAAGADAVGFTSFSMGERVGVAVKKGEWRKAVTAPDLSDIDGIVTLLTDWMDGLPRS